MSIEQDLRTELTAAMKAQDRATANVIRMISTKVMERRTAKGFKGQVDDALHIEVISAYKKSLEKAKQPFEAAGEAGKANLAELEFEIAYCSKFLPAMKSDDEVRKIVADKIAELGATDPKMAGRIVGAIMKEYKGQVEAKTVKNFVESTLST